jgi:hypothetical protein
MNFNFEEVQEEKSNGGSYLKHGIHKVKVTEIKLLNLTGNYTGEAADVTFANASGASTTYRMFPFKYNPTWSKFVKKEKVVQTEAEQFRDYQAKIKHIFNKAFNEADFKKALTGVKSFADIINGLASVVPNAQEFYLMLIDEKGYAKVPKNWIGGFASLDEQELVEKWDAGKYGKQTAPVGEIASSGGADLAALMGMANTPTPSFADIAGENSDDSEDLPF